MAESRDAAKGVPPDFGKARRWAIRIGLAVLALLVIGIIASAVSSPKKHKPSQTSAASNVTTTTTTTTTAKVVVARKCSSYKEAKPLTCISKSGDACKAFAAGSRPSDCYTTAQLRVLVAKRKTHQLAVARARKKAAERAAAQAKAAAAAYAAANAWHQGYTAQDDNVYWKWDNGGSCQDFATSGCWHVAVITADGCASYVAVNANEYQGSAIVGNLLANQGYGIPAKTERVFELDADTDNVRAGNVQIDCE